MEGEKESLIHGSSEFHLGKLQPEFLDYISRTGNNPCSHFHRCGLGKASFPSQKVAVLQLLTP